MLFRYGSCLGLLLLLLAAPAGSATQDAFKAGRWRGEILLSDSSGAFQGCIISTPLEGETSFGFALFLNGHLGLLVQNVNWVLPEGESYPVTLAVDAEEIGRFQASALRDNVVHIDLGSWEEAPIRRLRHGEKLVLRAEASGREFNLNLTDTYSALPRLHECFLAHADSNPFNSNNPEQDRKRVNRALRVVFREMVQSWTWDAGLPEPRFRSAEAPAGRNLSWSNPGHYWARLTALPREAGEELRPAVAGLQTRFSRTCTRHSAGEPQISPIHPVSGNDAYAAMFQGRCRREDSRDYWQWAMLYPGGEGTAFLVVILGPDRSQVEPLGRAIWRQETRAEDPPSFEKAALTI
ncbi:hypothetical protein [Thiohalorhabdus methylotrophus]|uniref:Uncharacterized protein n=1 Tax=Thiohalorhabdus methylotrophus TaxID=3242694 RepID=A0ABV4TV29_9GAMM